MLPSTSVENKAVEVHKTLLGINRVIRHSKVVIFGSFPGFLFADKEMRIAKRKEKKRRDKNQEKMNSKTLDLGESGYRSRYFPHAKRALYHLS